MTLETLTRICYIWIAIAVIVFITMFFVTAPFGRHTSEKWGIMINNKLGWVIMEFPFPGHHVVFPLFRQSVIFFICVDPVWPLDCALCQPDDDLSISHKAYAEENANLHCDECHLF
jgi:hypothetical protein